MLRHYDVRWHDIVTQMLMNVLQRTEAAVHTATASMALETTLVTVLEGTLATDITAQVILHCATTESVLRP